MSIVPLLALVTQIGYFSMVLHRVAMCTYRACSHDARYVFHMYIASPAGAIVYETARTFGVQVWSGMGTVAQDKTEYLMQLAVPPLSWPSSAGAYLQVAVFDVPDLTLLRVSSDRSAIQELMIAMITRPVMLQDVAKAVAKALPLRRESSRPL